VIRDIKAEMLEKGSLIDFANADARATSYEHQGEE
jgi:hypothetical protein